MKLNNVAIQFIALRQLTRQKIVLNDILVVQKSEITLNEFTHHLEGYLTQKIQLKLESSMFSQALTDSQSCMKLSNHDVSKTYHEQADQKSDLFVEPKLENQQMKQLQREDLSMNNQENNELTKT